MAPEADVVVLLLGLLGMSSASEHGRCKNYRLQFERVFSVPGDVALLNSTLLSPSVFNLSATPYNVTWYRLHSHRPIRSQRGRVLVRDETLWLLNVTLEDAGDYVTVVSTPDSCFRQQTKLVVEGSPSSCGRPRTTGKSLSKGVTDRLSCPLKGYMQTLSRHGVEYTLSWYKGCELVSHDHSRLHYWESFLKVVEVQREDRGQYTCTLNFSLEGVSGSVSETIDAEVKGDYCLLPQVREPADDVIRAELGSSLTRRCLVFVPCEGRPRLNVDVYWLVEDGYIADDPSERVYSSPQRVVTEQEDGVWMENWLVFSELKETDFNLNYTCLVLSERGSPYCYFTLLHTDPEHLLPVGLLLGSCLLLFLLCVSIYRLFKVDLVLWARGAFPTRKHSTASDGKLYDAYVAYPQGCAESWGDQVETFALLTLPQVLEEVCGYSLFIPGRDCLPGGALVDSVEENLQCSRRMILLYGATTFSKKNCSNNNTLLSRPTADHTDSYDQRSTKNPLNNYTEPPDLSPSQDPLQRTDNSVSLKLLHAKAPQGPDPRDMKGPDPQDMKGPDPQDMKGSNPQDRKGSDSQDMKGPNPQDMKGPDPEDMKGPDSQDMKGPYSQDMKGPNPQDMKGPNPQDMKGPDPQDMKGSDSQDMKGPDSLDRKGSNPQDRKGSNPQDRKGSDPQDMKGLNPQDMKGPNPLDMKGLNPLDMKGPDPLDMKGPDSQDMKGPDSQDMKGPNPQDRKGSDSLDMKGPNPQDMRGPDPLYKKGSDPQDMKGPDPQDMKDPDPQDLKGPDPLDMKGPDSQDMKGPDPQDMKGPDSQDRRGPDPQNMKVPDSEDMKGPDPQSGPQSGGDPCGHARTQLECVAAMHRALLERSLKVILVELEELAAADVEQLPQSVRHLRQVQGAVCWWKTRRGARAPWRTRGVGDVETPLSSCVNPNSRFWKEVRYRMPV